MHKKKEKEKNEKQQHMFCTKAGFPFKILKHIHIISLNQRSLTNQDESCGLEEPLIIPVWMLLLKNVTHTIVFPEPDSSIHHETWDQTEGFVAYSKAIRLRHMRWIVHIRLNLTDQGRINLTIQNLKKDQKTLISQISD